MAKRRRKRTRGGGNSQGAGHDQQPGGRARQKKLDYIDGSPDKGSVDDAAVERYSSRDRQDRLRRRIEGQRLPVRERLHTLEAGLEGCLSRKGMLLLQGETGSGKSVYSPVAMRRVLTKLGLQDRTVMMQPRKDAASGIARAASAVMGEELGRGVGFSTSEARRIDRRSALNVVTPGIFLRYLMRGDLTKEKVGAIIVDEMHEGSINYHLALGLIKMMQERGEAPLTLLTSATMNKERIQEFFGIDDRDYLRIEGRAHPVDKYYQVESEARGRFSEGQNYIQQVSDKVKELCSAEGDGDILVFLPGGKEIRDVIRRIGTIDGVEVLPLYGQLGPADRDRALSGSKGPGVQRRVIVSTNVAETSVTVPGIKVVVDSCRQRSVRYNPKTGIIEMGTELISKDQAEQRAGRAGRVTAGKCYRMVTEAEFAKMRQHPESEISRTNLANLVLRLKRLGIDPEEFPFIEPPREGAIAHGIAELTELGAMTEEGELTGVGREMAELPFEPRIGRMVVEAKKRGCIEAALILAAFERESNVLLGPSRRDINDAPGYDEGAKRRNARNAVHRIQDKFDRGNSDLLKTLNIFSQAIEHGVFEASDRRRSPEARAAKNNFKKWCKENYLKAEALTHIAYKLRDYARYAGVRIDRSTLQETLESANDADLGAVILAGHPDRLLYALGNKRGLSDYRQLFGAGEVVNMSPGSEGFDSRPQLCVASTISEGRGTYRGKPVTRNYASGVHPIGIEQLREVMPHLVVEKIAAARYNAETDQVESEVIFHPKGTTSVKLGKESRVVEGEAAVQAFAQALVNARVDLPCVAHNRALIKQLDSLFHRSRGQVRKPGDMTEWYVERLSGTFRKSEAKYINDQLQLQLEDFYPAELQVVVDRQYPETVTIGGKSYTITYNYRPADERWGQPESFSARITIDPEDLFSIDQSQIPVLGSTADPTEITIESRAGWSTISGTKLDELKGKVDAYRIEREWNAWDGKPDSREIQVAAGQPLPALDELGDTIEYSTTWRGEPVLAYPAVTTERVYDNEAGSYVEKFVVRYYPSQEEAGTAHARAVEKKAEIEAQEERRLYVEKMIGPATARVEEIGGSVEAILEDPTRVGMTSGEAHTLGTQYREAKGLVEGRDRYGRVQELDPRRALELCDEIQRKLDDIKRISRERADLLPQAEEMRDGLVEVATEVINYSRYSRYGLTAEEYDNLDKKWRQAQSLIGNPGGDVALAIELMKEVREALQSERIASWTSEAARAYAAVERSRRDGIYAKITVRDGCVYGESGEEIKEFTIGGSGREMLVRRGKDGQVRVQAFYASGNPMSEVMVLPNGSYAISRDADRFFRVDLGEGGQVVAVHEEVRPEVTDENDIVSDHVVLDVMAQALGGVKLSRAGRGAKKAQQPKRKREDEMPKIDPEERARAAREYQAAEAVRIARNEEHEREVAAAEAKARELAEKEKARAAERNKMRPEVREGLVAQLQPVRAQIEMMRLLVSETKEKELEPLTERLSGLEARIGRAQGIKKVTKETRRALNEIERALEKIAAEAGWPSNWQERSRLMLEGIIPALQADPSIELSYDPEADYKDMMEVIVLSDDIADDEMKEEFLGYYS